MLQVKEKVAPYANAGSAAIIRETSSAYVAQDSVGTEADSHVRLFRNLFIGRDDVYAEHWYGKDGKSNYSPAKAHEWDKHVIDPKTHRKICTDSCKLLPVTEKVIAEHLNGKRIIGTYPLLQDDGCRFLAIDFDKSTWQKDCLAFLETCSDLAVPAYLERSRSGAGGHIWIFFDKPLPASAARSEKQDKRLANRALRRSFKESIAADREVYPLIDDVSNV